MATRGKKKPVKRKRPTSSGSRLTAFGWVATGLVAVAWAATDGRPALYASTAIERLQSGLQTDKAVDRVAALIRDDRPTRAVSTAAPPPRNPPLPQDRTGSIRPSPKPEQEARRIVATVPLPSAAPLLPLAAPPTEFAMREARPLPLPATSVPVGQERHATRSLAAHSAPDASSAKLAEIDSGSSVFVLRSAGDWRYVRSARSGVEGWVDGRFLAGQSMSADLAALAQEDLSRR